MNTFRIAAARTRLALPSLRCLRSMCKRNATTTSAGLRASPVAVAASGRTGPCRSVTQSLSSRTSVLQQRRMMVRVTQTRVADMPSDNDDQVPQSDGANDVPYDLVDSDVLAVTETCLRRIESLVRQKRAKNDDNDDDDGPLYLRVYVDAGGCSGFSYKFELDTEDIEDGEDVVVARRGNDIRLVVDETSLNYIRGSTIDYVQEMIKSSFVVSDNPQSESACGCGSSFAVKNFAANPALD